MFEFVKKIGSRLSPDYGLQKAMDSAIYTTQMRYAVSSSIESWAPGKPLKLLFAGYAGSRNTGADVRVEEMIRQIRHLLGDENIALSIMTIDTEATRGYFSTVTQLEVPQIFPPFLYSECPKHHGVIACEGSMFKSKFADALSVMMAGSLGMANAERKLSIGYGAEAGAMTPTLKHFVQKQCRDSLVICRNEESQEVLQKINIRTRPGADTAWTFTPSPKSVGEKILKEKGWDGKQDILMVCPINPFWWPVKANVVKRIQNIAVGKYKDQHYKSIYFHDYNKQDQKSYETYIQALAKSAKRFATEHNLFVAAVGMEKLDRRACEDFSKAFGSEQLPPVIVSDQYHMYDMISILRKAKFMVSSRFHAIVCSMPGQVLSVGVTMDERIRNLMNLRGHENLYTEVDDQQLEHNVYQMLSDCHQHQKKYQEDMCKTVVGEMKKMADMGKDFLEELKRVYPEFASKHQGRDWQSYLPQLSDDLTSMVEKYS
ncbi:MAG: polysaccharide pyruvyl transferase family protein [Bdellovibrionales bacterium]|nr:polysaccharide pyruvyl transferase family protein [Bdellovibrionales bacterium]